MTIKSHKWTQQFTDVSYTHADMNKVFLDFHNKLLFMGLSAGTDTGQCVMNGSTSPASSMPANGQTYYGYKMYVFNDSLSGSSPMYLRVDYRSASGLYPGFDFTIGGPTTDGEGNIANAVSCTNLYPSSAAAALIGSAQPYTAECYMILDDGVLSILLGNKLIPPHATYYFTRPDAPNDRMSYAFVMLGRGVDSLGNPKGDRVFALNADSIMLATVSGMYSTLNVPRCECREYNNGVTYTNDFSTTVWPENGTPLGGVVPVNKTYLYYHDTGRVLLPNLVTVSVGQMGELDTTALTLLSTEEQFIHISDSFTGCNPVFANTAYSNRRYTSPVIRWNGVWE